MAVSARPRPSPRETRSLRSTFQKKCRTSPEDASVNSTSWRTGFADSAGRARRPRRRGWRRTSRTWRSGRGLVEDALYRGQESHVRHPVCLVDDGDAHVLQTDVAPVDEVLEPAGTGHQDVHRLPQGPQLGSVTGTAVDGGDAEAYELSRADRVRRIPERRARGSARARDPEDARPSSGNFPPVPPRRLWQKRASCRARRARSGDVAAGERVRKGCLLDGKRVVMPSRGKSAMRSAGTPRSAKVGGKKTPVSSKRPTRTSSQASPATAGNRSSGPGQECSRPRPICCSRYAAPR